MINPAIQNLVSCSEVARRYGVHINTVYGWKGAGMEVTPTGRNRFKTTWEAVDAFLRQIPEEEQDDLQELRERHGTEARRTA